MVCLWSAESWVQLSIVRSCVLWRWNVSQLNLVIFHKTLHLKGTLQSYWVHCSVRHQNPLHNDHHRGTQTPPQQVALRVKQIPQGHPELFHSLITPLSLDSQLLTPPQHLCHYWRPPQNITHFACPFCAPSQAISPIRAISSRFPVVHGCVLFTLATVF